MPVLSRPDSLSTTWLDELPEEITDHIAEYVTVGTKCYDALNLGAVSENQCRSVARSLPHPIFTNLEEEYRSEPFLMEEDIIRWSQVFADYPMSIRTSQCTPFDFKIFREANICSVHIEAENIEILEALRMQRSVREVSMMFTPLSNVGIVVKLLSPLVLEHLTLYEDGSFESLVPFAEAAARCINSCGPSTTLTWVCNNDRSDTSRSYWDAVALLPDCACIEINANPPERLIAKLRQFHSVELSGMPSSMAARLGSNVVRYSQSFQQYIFNPQLVLDSDQVMKLENCPQISELVLYVAQSAENAVAELITKLPCLTCLTLSWKHDFEDEHTDSTVDLTPGLTSSMLAKSTKLESLEIRYANISLKEWEHILSKIGGTLTSLTIYVDVPELEMYELALKFLTLLSKYCGNMEVLAISSSEKPKQDLTEDVENRLSHALEKMRLTNPKVLALYLMSGEAQDDEESDEEEGGDNNNGEDYDDNGDDENNGDTSAEEGNDDAIDEED